MEIRGHVRARHFQDLRLHDITRVEIFMEAEVESGFRVWG